MGTEIKTREVRRDIKVLDKPAIAAERIRQSHVRTKEDMAQTKEQATPVEYAEDRVVGGMDIAVQKGVHHVRGQGGRLAGAVKERRRARRLMRGRRRKHGGKGDRKRPSRCRRAWIFQKRREGGQTREKTESKPPDGRGRDQLKMQENLSRRDRGQPEPR